MVDEKQKRSPSSDSNLMHWSENIWEELNSIASIQTSIERLLSSRTTKQIDETRKHFCYQTGEVSKQMILDLIYNDYVFGDSTSSSRHDELSATNDRETANCTTFNVDQPSQETQTANQSRNPETIVTDRKNHQVNKACQSNIRSTSSKDGKIRRVKKPEHNVTIPIDCSKISNQSREQGKTVVVLKTSEKDRKFDKGNNNDKDDLVEEEFALYHVISASLEKNMNVLDKDDIPRNKSTTHATIESTNEKKKLIRGKIQGRDLKKSMKSIHSERNQIAQNSFFPSSGDEINQKCSSKLIQILKRENEESKMALTQSAIVLNNFNRA